MRSTESNSRLNELSETREGCKAAWTEYLSVKNTDTLEAYYQSCQELNGQLQGLNEEICGNEMLMMERNIRQYDAGISGCGRRGHAGQTGAQY